MSIFKSSFKITEIRENGVPSTQLIVGNRREVKREMDIFKRTAKAYFMIGKNEMIVLV